MPRTFSKSAFYSFGDIPLAAPLPPIFSHLLSHCEISIYLFDKREMIKDNNITLQNG